MNRINSNFARTGNFTREEIKKTMPEGRTGDDLANAYAGDNNKGPARNQKTRHSDTNVKGRETAKSKSNTKVR